jgi:hypothetical protein
LCRECIKKATLDLPEITQTVPLRYLALEEAVLAYRSQNTDLPLLKWRSYASLAAVCGIEGDNTLSRATKFLKNLGSIMIFDVPSGPLKVMALSAFINLLLGSGIFGPCLDLRSTQQNVSFTLSNLGWQCNIAESIL